MKGLLNFLFQFIPPLPQILIFSAVSATAILVSGILSGALKRYAHWIRCRYLFVP